MNFVCKLWSWKILGLFHPWKMLSMCISSLPSCYFSFGSTFLTSFMLFSLSRPSTLLCTVSEISEACVLDLFSLLGLFSSSPFALLLSLPTSSSASLPSFLGIFSSSSLLVKTILKSVWGLPFSFLPLSWLYFASTQLYVVVFIVPFFSLGDPLSWLLSSSWDLVIKTLFSCPLSFSWEATSISVS